jgi:hypothetical protein
MSHKPMIRYSEIIVPPVVGGRAVIKLAEPHHTIDSARLQMAGNVVTTSTVQEVEEGTGRFKTLNTFYVPDGMHITKSPHKAG